MITNAQLGHTLIAAGIPAAAIDEPSDSFYIGCQSGWLTGDFHRWFRTALESLGVWDYEPERADCDKKAVLFAALAGIAHARTPGGKGAALGIGRINFTLTPGYRHAINWALTPDKGIIFPEPQVVGRVLTLTPAQLASITKCTR